MRKAQAKQKLWYDKRARELKLKEGDRVLVLLPTTTDKLMARWHGPYPITRVVSQTNYEVKMTNKRRKKCIFHINMLRPWTERVEPPEVVLLAAEDSTQEDELPVEWRNGNACAPLITAPDLPDSHRHELTQLLAQFTSILRETPGRTTLTEHTIPLQDPKPIQQAPYRIPRAYQSEVMQELKEMLAHGIIEPSTSTWASPIVVVKKKDGSARICIDYRKLNAQTDLDAYPLPRIEDILGEIGQARYITTLDLAKGYWQVPVSEADRSKTAFISPLGLFQFCTMPFGLCGAPATFQRMMDQIIWGRHHYVRAYLDDLVIFSKTWEEHLEHLNAVFQLLQDAGLTIKLKKCQFVMQECSYLGHVIGHGVTRPEAQKIKAIRSYPQPRTKKEVRSFLGLAGYYQRFIPNFAEQAKPLTDLTKKGLPDQVSWTPLCQDAFSLLKDALSKGPVLCNPNFDRPFTLQTDASEFAIGAVLSQMDDDGLEHPVSYYSKKLLPRESRYATVEKECLALKLGIEQYSVYLTGRKFTVQTDHRALQWLNRMRDQNSRLTRWSLALQPYQFDVIHRQGRAHTNADALSRISDLHFVQEKEGEMWQNGPQYAATVNEELNKHQLTSISVGPEEVGQG